MNAQLVDNGQDMRPVEQAYDNYELNTALLDIILNQNYYMTNSVSQLHHPILCTNYATTLNVQTAGRFMYNLPANYE